MLRCVVASHPVYNISIIAKHNNQEYHIQKYQNITNIGLPGPSSLGASLCPWDSCETHDNYQKKHPGFAIGGLRIT